MAIVSCYYGTLIEAGTYFGARLHEYAWSEASTPNREKALRAATEDIDKLNFKGDKAGGAAQELEFPRGTDTEVPEDIRKACYEIAYSRLDGKDPEMELEMLAVSSQGVSSVRTTFSRGQPPPEHIVNGIVSLRAWRLLTPFLRDAGLVRTERAS